MTFSASAARDLLCKILQIDPEKRISIDEAVSHPYVNLWFRDVEWDLPLPENRYDANNDITELPINSWRGYHQINLTHSATLILSLLTLLQISSVPIKSNKFNKQNFSQLFVKYFFAKNRQLEKWIVQNSSINLC